MRILPQKPNYVRIAFLPEPDDPEYTACTWAYFDFDTDEWMLNIQSDIGEFAHAWPKGKGETFLQLCARMSEDYIEQKLFHENYTVFDEAGTLDNLREYLDDAGYDGDEIDDLIDDLRYTLDDYDLEKCVPLAEHLVCEWAEDNKLGLVEPWTLVESDLTAWQKRIVRIFTKYVQPTLKRILKEGGQA